jgi:dTDP-4-dehydrorhamnose reductase
MRVLITGAAGQLGQELQRTCPPSLELLAFGREQLDLVDAAACRAVVEEHQPDWLINAGAYTAVDRAESEPELAHRVNAQAPGAFAAALHQTGGSLLQVSTDSVFNGKQGHPYQPEQVCDPIGVYGSTKAAGEKSAAEELSPERLAILRTSWVYGPVGRNFLLTMLRLHAIKAEAGDSLRVVADQVGCPTSTTTLAQACWAVIDHGAHGMHHCSDAGAASWYDFAVAIGALGVASGRLSSAACVEPITTSEYPTPAQRPGYSLLDCSATRSLLGLPACHWRAVLAEVIDRIP